MRTRRSPPAPPLPPADDPAEALRRAEAMHQRGKLTATALAVIRERVTAATQPAPKPKRAKG